MKGHLIVIGSVAVGVALVLIVRDNMPKQSFSIKKSFLDCISCLNFFSNISILLLSISITTTVKPFSKSFSKVGEKLLAVRPQRCRGTPRYRFEQLHVRVREKIPSTPQPKIILAEACKDGRRSPR